MRIIQGKGVSDGIAVGRIRFYKRDELSILCERIDDPDEELRRFETAKLTAVSQLDALYNKALTEVGEENAMIFDVHRMLIDDPDYNDSVEGIIRSRCVNAEYAVALTSDDFSEMFATMDDEYMRERSADIRDISNRIMKCLMNMTDTRRDCSEGDIICADDLSPSETIQLDKENILAFCTAQGSYNSHSAILARTMNIPAVTGLGADLLDLPEGTELIIDGESGAVYINPDIITKKEMLKKRANELRRREALQSSLSGRENITLDGRRVSVFANASGVNDITAAKENGCEGIGLLRSEFLYYASSDYPSEEYQYHTYRRVLERMNGKLVVIRTLDIAADKGPEYISLEEEDNPALGRRAIRFCLSRPDIFKTQLRALMRASAYGKLGIVFPMIISLDEIREIKAMLAKVKQELSEEKLPYSSDVEIGIMIETPAAVMISDLLAREVDFFEIGSNDLAQYTLAIDRQNPELDRHIHHQAVLRMIKLAADNAHKNGAWIGICGELGADTQLTEMFLAMGVDMISVAPSKILPLREKILATDMSTNCNILSEMMLV